MYGAKFTDQWRTTPPKVLRRVWAQGLTGYTAREVQTGIEACRATKWPPTLPEFLMLCRPPVDHEAAFLEAAEQLRIRHTTGQDTWTAPAIFYAARAMSHEVESKPFSAVRAQWTRELDRAIKRVDAGYLPREVPPAPVALPHEHNPTPAPEGVRLVRLALATWIGRMTGKEEA